MQVLQVQKKGTHLHTIERFHIHKEAAQNNHLNDDHKKSEKNISYHTSTPVKQSYIQKPVPPTTPSIPSVSLKAPTISIPSDTEEFATQEIPAQYTNNQVRQAV